MTNSLKIHLCNYYIACISRNIFCSLKNFLGKICSVIKCEPRSFNFYFCRLKTLSVMPMRPSRENKSRATKTYSCDGTGPRPRHWTSPFPTYMCYVQMWKVTAIKLMIIFYLILLWKVLPTSLSLALIPTETAE